MAANVPFNDRLAAAQLLSMAPDPGDPTNIMISLHISTMGQKMKMVDFMVSNMSSSLQKATDLAGEVSGTAVSSAIGPSSDTTNIY